MHWDFNRDCIETMLLLGSAVMLTILSLPIHENEISFHLFRFFLSLDNVLQFSVCKSYASLVKFISKYVVPFYATLMELLSSFCFQIIHYYLDKHDSNTPINIIPTSLNLTHFVKWYFLISLLNFAPYRGSGSPGSRLSLAPGNQRLRDPRGQSTSREDSLVVG